MSRPEAKDRGSRTTRTPRVAVVALVVAVVGAVVTAGALVALDLHRGSQVRDLQLQVESLQHLVEAMRLHLEHHDKVINSTLHAKNTPKSEPSEEVVYENEYEYDDEDEYEEYDEGDERNTKATVKRMVVQSGNVSEGESSRRKREVDELEESTTLMEEHERKPAHQRSHQNPVIYQEQERGPETVRYRHRNSRTRSRHPSERESLEHSRELSQPESFSTTARRQQPHVVAAHFIGDTSRYNQRDHHHYYGNDILYHPHNFFKDWAPASWMSEDDLRFFPIQEGKLKVQESGLYFVYAQIFYSTTHNHCGFHIKHNNNEVAQCTRSTTGPGLKRNTCYTAVMLRLERQDLLWLKEVEGHRNTSFRDSHSYFGLIRLSPGDQAPT